MINFDKKIIALVCTLMVIGIGVAGINYLNIFTRPTSEELANKYFNAVVKRDKESVWKLIAPSCTASMSERIQNEIVAISNIETANKKVLIERSIFEYREKIWINFDYRFSGEKEWKKGSVSLISDYNKETKERFLCGQDSTWVSPWPKEAAKVLSYSLIISGSKHMEKANQLASQGALAKDKIGEEVQASIRDLKEATTVSPDLALGWSYLARTYRDIIGIADGADKWAITSYTKAIELDPSNSQAYMELGGVYYKLKNYKNAALEFEKYTQLLPDDPNGYYNLGYTYKKMGERNKAKLVLEKALTLVSADSDGGQKIIKELNSLR